MVTGANDIENSTAEDDPPGPIAARPVLQV